MLNDGGATLPCILGIAHFYAAAMVIRCSSITIYVSSEFLSIDTGVAVIIRTDFLLLQLPSSISLARIMLSFCLIHFLFTTVITSIKFTMCPFVHSLNVASQSYGIQFNSFLSTSAFLLPCFELLTAELLSFRISLTSDSLLSHQVQQLSYAIIATMCTARKKNSEKTVQWECPDRTKQAPIDPLPHGHEVQT